MRRLRQLPVDLSLLGAELDAMFTVRVGPTRDRSVVGTMVDFAKALPYYFDDTPTLQFAEERLAETPCRAGSRDVIFPVEATLRLLQDKWAVSGTRH